MYRKTIRGNMYKIKIYVQQNTWPDDSLFIFFGRAWSWGIPNRLNENLNELHAIVKTNIWHFSWSHFRGVVFGDTPHNIAAECGIYTDVAAGCLPACMSHTYSHTHTAYIHFLASATKRTAAFILVGPMYATCTHLLISSSAFVRVLPISKNVFSTQNCHTLLVGWEVCALALAPLQHIFAF